MNSWPRLSIEERETGKRKIQAEEEPHPKDKVMAWKGKSSWGFQKAKEKAGFVFSRAEKHPGAKPPMMACAALGETRGYLPLAFLSPGQKSPLESPVASASGREFWELKSTQTLNPWWGREGLLPVSLWVGWAFVSLQFPSPKFLCCSETKTSAEEWISFCRPVPTCCHSSLLPGTGALGTRRWGGGWGLPHLPCNSRQSPFAPPGLPPLQAASQG